MLVQRILSAIVAIPILLSAVWLGDHSRYPVYSALVAVAALWAAMEFYGLTARAGHGPLRWLGTGLAVLFVANACFAGRAGSDFTGLLVAGTVLLPLVLLLRRANLSTAFTDWAITLAGVLYTGGLLSYFVLLRQADRGMEWVLLTLLSTFAADTSAFFIGRRFGRTKLAPLISPNKTREGAVAGLVGGTLATVALVQLFHLPVPFPVAVGLGLLVALAAEVGDLAESMLKRSMHVKDASHLIPGHGGMLDRMDSLVFTVVVVYHYVVFGLSWTPYT